MRTRRTVLDATLREHGEELYARAFVLTGHTGSADQLLEDALQRALRGIRTPSSQEVRVDAMHAMHRILARRRPGPVRAHAGPSLDEIADAPDLRGPGTGAAALHWNVRAAREFVAGHDAHEDDERAAIVADFSALLPAERVCLVLRFLDGKPAPAIAAEVGLSVARVQQLLEGAVRRLAAHRPWLALDPDEAIWGGDEVVQIEVDS